MKFAALGRTSVLLNSIHAARERGHECVLIATCAAAPEYSAKEADFEQLAEQVGCPFICDVRLDRREHLESIRASGAEIAISVNWTSLLPADVLGAFRHGVLNAHAGDLPRYRGNAVVGWAMLQQEPAVVLSLHRMVEALDAGPVVAKREVPLNPTLYIGEVLEALEAIAPHLFADALDACGAGRLSAENQPEAASLSLRCFPRLPRDGAIDWWSTAQEIARLVRASSEPYAGAFTHLDGEQVVVWRARAEPAPYPYLAVPGQVVERRLDTGEVIVAAADGWLVLEEIETESGGRGGPTERIRSIRTRLGLDPAGEILALRRRIAALEEALARSALRAPS